MNIEPYRILIEREGTNHVKVFKAERNSYVNDWNFPLKGDDKPIIFKDFYTESRFAIINWDGWIRLYDTNTKATLVDHKLNGDSNTSAILSLDKTKLYVTYKEHTGYDNLVIFDVNTYELQTLALPAHYKVPIQMRKDGCLLFYKHDWEYIADEKVYKHFYFVLNIETLKINQFELAFAAQFSFGDFNPVIDITNNRIIMPLYDDVATKKTTSEELVIDYRIALFDLSTFDVTHILSVRDFTTNQLGCYESVNEKMAEVFLGSKRDKNYIKMQREFFKNLNTIKIVEDGMWLCWRGGIVRKINSDLSLSPLLVTHSMSNNSVEGMFNHGYFHSHLYHVDKTTLVLAEHLNFSKTFLPNIEGADIETPIPLHLESTSLDELYNITYSKENIKEIELPGSIQIKVKDLATTESIMKALYQIETIVSDVKAAGIGKLLLFIFKDEKGNTKSEPAFFAEATSIAPDRIQQILEKLIANNSIKYLYRNEEETVLCHAVFELVQNGDSYFNTVIKYLDAIDLDHDVFNRENLIPYLEETYSVEVLQKKTKAMSSKLGEWYEYYREETDD